MRVTLTVTGGQHEGRVFCFVGHDTLLVGRSRHAHLRLPSRDYYCSRMHFLVEVNPPYCRLLDLGSNNGTHVNGQRVQQAELSHGDEIRAGRNLLRVEVENGEGILASTLVQQGAKLPETVDFPAGVLVSGGPPRGGAITPPSAVAGPAPEGYRLVRPLGRGGMGIVHQAVRLADGQMVALKTITPAVAGTSAQVERFLREANILRELSHPHVVAFCDMGEWGGRFFFAMDYIVGSDAYQVVRREGPLAVGRAVGLMADLLNALAHAHARGFVHRDVKPSNVLVTRTAGREKGMLADFGLARVYQASQLSGLTLLGEVGGTPAFIAPEQITQFREVQPPADQYSAAATLYYLLTGQTVYDLPGDLWDQFRHVLEAEPIPLRRRRPQVHAALAEAVHRALDRDPARRFPDVAAFRAALAPFVGAEC